MIMRIIAYVVLFKWRKLDYKLSKNDFELRKVEAELS